MYKINKRTPTYNHVLVYDILLEMHSVIYRLNKSYGYLLVVVCLVIQHNKHYLRENIEATVTLCVISVCSCHVTVVSLYSL